MQELTTGIDPAMIYLARVARLVLVVNKQDQTMSVFSVAESGTLSDLQTIKMQQNPTAIEMDPTGRFFYIALENSGISRFTMGEEGRLIFTDTVATAGGVSGLKIGDTGQVLIAIPKTLNKVCAPGEKCKSWRKKWKHFTAQVRKVAKVIVDIVRVATCPVGGPIQNFLNPACGLWSLVHDRVSLQSDHWYRELLSKEVTVELIDNTSGIYRNHINQSIAEWSQSSRVNLRRVSGHEGKCRFALGYIVVCNGNYGPVKWYGIASTVAIDGHAMMAFIRLNDFYLMDNIQEERQSTVCQEIGHALGLYDMGWGRSGSGHRGDDLTDRNLGTCMHSTKRAQGGIETIPWVDPITQTEKFIQRDWGPSNISPDQADFDYLKKIHDHYDGAINVDRTILNVILPPIGLFGHPSTKLSNGKAHRYQLDLGRGYKMTTDVLWK